MFYMKCLYVWAVIFCLLSALFNVVLGDMVEKWFYYGMPFVLSPVFAYFTKPKHVSLKQRTRTHG